MTVWWKMNQRIRRKRKAKDRQKSLRQPDVICNIHIRTIHTLCNYPFVQSEWHKSPKKQQLGYKLETGVKPPSVGWNLHQWKVGIEPGLFYTKTRCLIPSKSSFPREFRRKKNSQFQPFSAAVLLSFNGLSFQTQLLLYFEVLLFHLSNSWEEISWHETISLSNINGKPGMNNVGVIWKNGFIMTLRN